METRSSKLLAQAWCVGANRKQWGDTILYGYSGTNASSSSTLLWDRHHNLAIASISNVPPLGYPFAYAVFAAMLKARFGLEAPQSRSRSSTGLCSRVMSEPGCYHSRATT
jgi:hypothetical protein